MRASLPKVVVGNEWVDDARLSLPNPLPPVMIDRYVGANRDDKLQYRGQGRLWFF